jgi:hypothetical protein
MRSKTLKGLTYGQYANHRKTLGLTGQTKQSVAAAVKSRRIAALPDGSIDPERADAQWQARTDPGKQRSRPANPERRAPKAPRRVDDDGMVKSQGTEIEDAIHAARISALAGITAVAEVLAFAKDCARLGCSHEVACALAQCYSVRAAKALPDVECDDFDERFGDPTPEEWRAVLGDVDLSEAEQLCNLVTL